MSDTVSKRRPFSPAARKNGDYNHVVVSHKLWFSGTRGREHCRDEGAMLRMFKFSIKISWQTPQLIPPVSASSCIVRRRSSWISSRNFSTFSVALFVLGLPERSSF
jgi:hypothetical protein